MDVDGRDFCHCSIWRVDAGWAAIQAVRGESESYSGKEIEGHTAEEILILFGRPGRSLKIANSRGAC